MNEHIKQLIESLNAGIVEEFNLQARLAEIQKQRPQIEGAILALRQADQISQQEKTDKTSTESETIKPKL